MSYICFTLHAAPPTPPSLPDCCRFDLYSSYNSVTCITSYDQEKEHGLAFKMMTNMCLAYGLYDMKTHTKGAICMGLWDTFPCAAMHAHPAHPVMVMGRGHRTNEVSPPPLPAKFRSLQMDSLSAIYLNEQ